MLNLIPFLTQNWATILTVLVILIEAILRLNPTEKNLSLIDLMHRIVNAILPNNAKPNPNEPGQQPLIGKVKFKIKK